MTPSEAAWYLAGLIDGEGCVYGHGRATRRVSIANSDPMIVGAACRALDVLGIPHRVYTRQAKPPRQEAYEVFISGRANLQAVYRLVPMQSVKRDRLRDMLLTFVKGDPVAATERLGAVDIDAVAAAADDTD